MARKSQETEPLDYLLGKLPDSEAEKFEQEYFADDDAFDRMLTAEDDLIDEYAANTLSDEERRRVSRIWLTSPEGRERIQFARSFAEVKNTQNTYKVEEKRDTPTRNPFAFLWSFSLASRAAMTAAALVIVAGFVFLLVERSRTQTELSALRSERARLDEKLKEMERLASLPKPQESVQPAPIPQVTEPTPQPRNVNEQPKKPDESVVAQVTFELEPGSVRGGGITTLRVNRRAKVVFLKLNLDAEASHESYRVIIETAGGREVARIDPFRRDRSATLKVPVSTNALGPGDYILLLSGKKSDGSYEGVANYSFRVVY